MKKAPAKLARRLIRSEKTQAARRVANAAGN